MLRCCSRLAAFVAISAAVPGDAQPAVGFLDQTSPGTPLPRNAAALAFARTQGTVTRLAWQAAGGWQGDDGKLHAPEECDVLWCHQAEQGVVSLGEAGNADLLTYLELGGTLLLSGSAGSLVNELGIEPTPLRVLGPTTAAYLSGLVVKPEHREHPAFLGLDASKPILLTSIGGNALADFYDTAGPHGELLAEGNAGVGERPLVEYTVGPGRVIVVGWRLGDFTTDHDEYRPNLERLYGNLLRYLADCNANRGRLVAPPGKSVYVRLDGVPFLRAEQPVPLSAPVVGEKWAAALTAQPVGESSFAVPDGHVTEQALTEATITVDALGLTLLTRERPVSQFVAARRAEQEQQDKHDRELMQGLRVVTPQVAFTPAPLKPTTLVEPNQSVLLGRSAFMAPNHGRGDITPVYEPIDDGGFRITGSTRQLNRPIVHGQNRVWTGDVPLFRMDTPTGNGCYAAERVFPLWARPDAQTGNVNPSMGTLRLGVRGADGQTLWLDTLQSVTTFRPGYTEYQVAGPEEAWTASIIVAPALDFHGMVCRVTFDKDVPLVWQYGGVWWQAGENNANRLQLDGRRATIAEANLPNGVVCVGWDGSGAGRTLQAPYGEQLEYAADKAQRVYHVVATWGVTKYDEDRAKTARARLDTPAAAGWPEWRDRLKQLWFDCYIGRASSPEEHFAALTADPDAALAKTCNWWDSRRQEFQVKTPDAQLNALMNWSRCTTEYHRQGPGLVLGAQIWQMYSHISTGWYGKEWGGDHQAIEECLRLYGAMQNDDGFIRWVAPSLVAFHAENNTAYWVDQVWRHYTWTGDKRFVRDLWPSVQKAVAWMQKANDHDGDGLFRDSYEYWNCDSHGKGPKSAVPSAMSWAMFDRAARMAAVLEDRESEQRYRALADQTHAAVFRELWRDDKGLLGSIGADGLWNGHPQIWNEYLAINAGLLDAEQGRRAMRWLAAHYGFQPSPGVQLLSCSDWWPIRWSIQWVPTGDTCLAALAGMKCGDADLWWPYLKTVVGSAFKSDFPGINMGISNAGAGGGDREDVDSVDPHVHCAVRGLFGLEPALQDARLGICPAFPSGWTDASIRTPDVSYEYHRDGQRATFRIHTPRPLVKRVRANLTGPEVMTPAETDSVVTVDLGPLPQPAQPAAQPTTLLEQTSAQRQTDPLLPPDHHSPQVLFDLSAAYNTTLEDFVATRFVYDYADNPSPVVGWWGNPALTMSPSPRIVETGSGVRFLTSGRPRPGVGESPKNLIALSSWRPYPLPAAATIPVGARCQELHLLLQNYVHPMKNYVPNGEVILHYAEGEAAVVSLVPPYNLDCYFQHFSLEGEPVLFGRLGTWPAGWTPISKGLAQAHADALEIKCDPSRPLTSVELRATCSEGAIGLAGMTAVAAGE
ncbi:MAG: hypothetical protein COZ06_19050 [Armatimonadetes bacterium CG_4_10_14_3_um_filter_66_18]|nr:hypothetical protein [Armatimonadota bacterium]OIP10673.1 MAG: hypothetical protein AUJ96_03575 [Armatimonadetes bacterium CG2_30_66_41]PIX41863.1 MAG: hypothetical protein COZ57_22465 [Armatimonadetes bacterium CG_4_8_14_3_um_filter_66_20]PIY45723.1 MAG: hypothetical protein COZ06_19050 [Armatimonadetes bacterium CG_4_10_14_3_um_filter_66_18]PJB63287.1 MAG: hypothetical protein CO096_22720 [Armatimonadetes bacterium CG_4_9_14_3_um_filter_66_14]